jgi:hypothetical protein
MAIYEQRQECRKASKSVARSFHRSGYYFGPGDAGDFDYGAWHVACHLVAAGGAMRSSRHLMWLEISHNPVANDYFANVTEEPEASCIRIG